MRVVDKIKSLFKRKKAETKAEPKPEAQSAEKKTEQAGG